MKQNFNLYGLPEKINTDKGGAYVSKEYKECCKSKKIEIEYSTPRLHTGTGAVERAIQTLRGVDGKYIQWNEILRDVLNGKLKIVQNQRNESESESEEGEIEDEESDFENHDTSEKDGRYTPVTTSPETN